MSTKAIELPKSGSVQEADLFPPKANQKVERVTVRLSGELGASIREMQDITSASSPSDVVRRAIAVYATLVRQKLQGNEPVVLSEKDGQKKTVPIFL